jgi:hypothetical protein
MKDLQTGDIIAGPGSKKEILARIENLVFTRELFKSGALGPVSSATDIEDLVSYGFNKQD